MAYWELALTVPPDVEEGLTNFLWELGALGVIEDETAGSPPRLRAFFAGDADPSLLDIRLQDYLTALHALSLPAPPAARLTPLADGNWAEAWRAHFTPLPVGRRLLVAPPWDVPPWPGRIAIVIEPGRAFGTGHHESTAGCLEALEAIIAVGVPAAAIDLGTGSGILAIAASRLGVGHLLAVDDDPDAVASAIGNAALNGVAERMTVVRADAAAPAADPAPLVLANLLTAAHLRLASAYRRYQVDGGALVLGGVLDGEAAALTEALRAQGFVRETTRSIQEWTTLVLRRAR
jgi:ribosomal protein L11 methyltransferase